MRPPVNTTAVERRPSSQTQLGIEDHRQLPHTTNQESDVFNEQLPPPSYATGGRTTRPQQPVNLEIAEPSQARLVTNQESHTINKPFQPPHLVAGGQRTPASGPHRLRIAEPRQPPHKANQDSRITNQLAPPLQHAGDGIITHPPPSSSSQRKLEIPKRGQPSLPLYSDSIRTSLPDIQDRTLQNQGPSRQHALGVKSQSHTIKKSSPSTLYHNFRCPLHTRFIKECEKCKHFLTSSTSQNQLFQSHQPHLPPQHAGSRSTQKVLQPEISKPPSDYYDHLLAILPPRFKKEIEELRRSRSSLQSQNQLFQLQQPSQHVSGGSSQKVLLPGISLWPSHLCASLHSSLSASQNQLFQRQQPPQNVAGSSSQIVMQQETSPWPSHHNHRLPSSAPQHQPFQLQQPPQQAAGDSYQIVLKLEISLQVAPSFEQQAPYGFLQIPIRVQVMESPPVQENSLSGSSSGLMQPPPGMSSAPAGSASRQQGNHPPRQHR